jgi:glyoxylase I family protein
MTPFDVRSMVHPSGLAVTLMGHDGTAKNDAFDERRVGLDHLAFRVSDRDELRRWVTHFDAKGVPHTGIIDTGFGPTVVFRDPDNVQLELYVHQRFDELTLSDADSTEARRACTAFSNRHAECAQTPAFSRRVGRRRTLVVVEGYFLVLMRVTMLRKSSVWNDCSSAVLA